MPSAIVTGGAGAIGSQLVSRLLAVGCPRVVVVDDLSSGFPWLVPDHDRVELIVRDVCDIGSLDIDGAGAWVFHLAAFFANQNSVEHPEADLRTNGFGTLATLKWAARAGARRVVYASAGCSIAGHNVEEAIGEDMPVSLFLSTPYQITKALGEFYCNYFNGSVSTVRCRFFNCYGPGEVPGRYRNVIPNFIWAALAGEPLVITGTGEETRDFIYVSDLVDGLLRAASTPEAVGHAFNLGTGTEVRIKDLAACILAATGSKSDVVNVDRRTWDHTVRRQARTDFAREVLDFTARTPLEVGISQTVEWFETNASEIGSAIRPSR